MKALVERARTTDRAAIVHLLSSCNLPTIDLPPTLENFVVIKNADSLMGTCGLEIYDAIALLRSLAVSADFEGKGLGNALYAAALHLAKEKNVKEVFLITNTAAVFFTKLGFTPVERSRVPATIQGTAQFSSVCPSSATIMYQKID
ncbi:amino acid acetyltransferase [Adhaeribacter arboris]|uniref:Amino acid acetyltransferase n=1 Tax=Adhaeribacter arboris TaxID=2072846 RepID=A0A2T2YJQ4_9BACT|nr:arsenic resistance N-acetyltransferase ArsN2 [Adhaeribacter arboris]PSR55705.1 amino acid acetyltransferase [Adhaeribacter arboris]